MFNTFIAQIFCGALGVAFVNGMNVEGGGLSRVVLNVIKFRIVLIVVKGNFLVEPHFH